MKTATRTCKASARGSDGSRPKIVSDQSCGPASAGCAFFLFSSCLLLLSRASSADPIVVARNRFPFSSCGLRGNCGHQVVPGILFFFCYLQERRASRRQALRRRRRRLFCRPGFRAAQRCSAGAQSQAAFELECRLKPGPGHFQQDLPVALRFGVAGPTHALLRELAEFCGGCGHGALYAGTGGSATGLSATGACVRAAGDKSHDITAETVAIAVSGCRHRSDLGAHASPGNDEKYR
jgi:hypothetical protein